MRAKVLVTLLLFSTYAVFAQEKTTVQKQTQKWQIRFRAIAAIPPGNSYDLSSDSKVTIGASVVPEVDFTYFFDKNFSAELILGTTHHKVKAKEDGEDDVTLGKVWLLPPTLNLQYHFSAKDFVPYIGAGINYTIFYGVKDDAAPLDYKNKVGFSTQLGFDYKISNKWFLNVDVKKIFLKTDVAIKGTSTVLNDVKVNPFVIGIGVGTRL